MECTKCGKSFSNKVIDEHEQGCLMMECSHCKRHFSSTVIDKHEYKCAEELSLSAKKKLMGIPETKASSYRNTNIAKVDSD